MTTSVKSILLFLTIILYSIPVYSHPDFIPQDKLLHFSTCYIISSTTTSLVYNITDNRKKAVMYGILTSVVIGGLKELHDRDHGDSDWNDMSANIVGGTLGSIVVVIKF